MTTAANPYLKEPFAVARCFGRSRYRVPAHDNGWRKCPETIFVWIGSGPYFCQMRGQPTTILGAGEGLIIPTGTWHRIGHDRPGICTWIHARYVNAGGGDPLAHLPAPARLAAASAIRIRDVVEDMLSQPCGDAPATVPEQLHVQGHALRLLGLLLGLFPAPTTLGTAGVDPRLAPVLAHLRLHFTRPLSRAHLARLAGLSLSQFHEVFSRATGLTPLGYIHAERARMAIDLLADRRILLAEIASRVGYGDEFHFSHRFKAETGLSPRAYRERWLIAGQRP